MRHAALGFCLLCLTAVPVGAQTVSAGVSGGFTYLGGLRDVLQVDSFSALSGSLFLDFELGGGTNMRLAANFAEASGVFFSSVESNVLWDFPLRRVRGFVGGGIGMFGMPENISSAVHMSVQGLVGIENDFYRIIVVKVTLQALQVLRLNDGFLPGSPLFRIEVGVGLPFRV